MHKEPAWMGRAVRQQGVIARKQALSLGMSPGQIRTMLDQGRWFEIFPQVYGVSGFPATGRQRLMAACLWVDGVASHTSAAALFGLAEDRAEVHVMTTRFARSRNDIQVHRTDGLTPADVTKVQGIPCLTPTRLLCDLGAHVDEEVLEAMLEEALRRRLTTVDRLRRRLDGFTGRGRRGSAPIARLLELRGDAPAAESLLEVKAIRLLRRHRLHPLRQHPVGRRRVDLAFADVRLGIELVGGEFHDGSAARQRDAVRHNELMAKGWTILYFTYRDVVDRPDYVVATVKSELKRLRSQLDLF